MKAKTQKKLEEGTLVRETIAGVFTEIFIQDPENPKNNINPWFLSLEDCLLQIVAKPNAGIKTNDEILVRVVPDHKSLERELGLLEKLARRVDSTEFIDDLALFARTISPYSSRFTPFLSKEEQEKYRQLFIKSAGLLNNLSHKNHISFIVARLEESVQQSLSHENVLLSRYSDLGIEIFAFKDKLDSIYSLFEGVDKKYHDSELTKTKQNVEKQLNKLRRLVKSSMLQIKKANAKDLPEILKSFDHFTDRFTEYRNPNTSGAHKRAILEFHQARSDEHYVFMLDGKIVGGLRVSAPTDDDRESIGYRALKEKDKNIMITGFGSSSELDKNIGQAIREAHSFITQELEYWRVYTGLVMKDVSSIASLEKGRLTASYARQELSQIHAAMVDAGFVPFKARIYDDKDKVRHNLGGCNGELIYRSKSVENHPGRTAQ